MSYIFNKICVAHYCESGWEPFENSCYIFTSEAKNQSEAENECLSHGAHLASIHSDQEGHFLSTLTAHLSGRIHSWIGLEWKENSYQWSDGSEFDYENWNAGEPNHWNEICAIMMSELGKSNHEKWYDVHCHSQFDSFICKRSVPGN